MSTLTKSQAAKLRGLIALHVSRQRALWETNNRPSNYLAPDAQTTRKRAKVASDKLYEELRNLTEVKP